MAPLPHSDSAPFLPYIHRVQLKCDGARWRTGGEVKGKLAKGVSSQYSSHYLGDMVHPALLPLIRTPRLPAVDWTDAPADLNGLVRFAERRNLVSARVPSHFKCSLLLASTWGLRPPQPVSVLRHAPSFRLAQAIFEPYLFSYKYPNNFIPIILPAYTACEDGTECSETSPYKIQKPGNHPKEKIQHFTFCRSSCVSYGSQNKQRLFPYKTLTD